MDLTEFIVTTHEQDFARLDQTFDHSAAVRDTVIAKLEPLVAKITLGDDDLTDKDKVNASMKLVTTLLTAVKDKDAAIAARVGLKLKRTESEREGNTAELVVQMLRQMAPSAAGSHGQAPPDAIAEAIERTYLEAGHTVLATELRERPDDIA